MATADERAGGEGGDVGVGGGVAGDRGSRGADPSLLALVSVVVRKQVMLLVRYPVNTASQFVTIYAFFLAIFLGGTAVGGAAVTDSLEGIIVGFFLWTLATIGYSGLAWGVTREAQWGTLERLYMSPHGFATVMAVKTVVNVALSFLWGGVLLVVMLVTTGRTLTVDPLTVVPLGVLTLASVVGIGFLFAGLAIVYKRIENLFQLMQFGFIGLIAAPVGSYPLLGLLPVSHGSYLIQRAMQDGVRLWEVPAWELGLLTVTAAVYLGVGLGAFTLLHRRARRLGVMGHY